MVETLELEELEVEPEKFEKLEEKSVDYVIALVDYESLKAKKGSYNVKLFGKSILEFVENACDKKPKTFKLESEEELLSGVKQMLGDSEYTVVLFSDTPLITTATVYTSVKHAIENNIDILKLDRGYVCKTEVLKNAFSLDSEDEFCCSDVDFIIVSNYTELSMVSDIMKYRILEYHTNRGVQILDSASTFIEAGVTIEPGTVIYPSNTICGATEIGENVTLFAGNRILNSIIGAESKIEGSSISSSVIGEDCKIKNSFIGNDALIKEDCKIIDGAVVKESIIENECKIMSASVKGAYINKNCKIYEGARIAGKDGNIVLQNNVSVGENAIIVKPCEIKECKKIEAGTILR